MAPLRLAHLVSHPIPYKAPLYRALAQRPEVELTVHFYSDASVRGYHDLEFGREVQWDTPLLEGYRSRFAPSSATTGVPGRGSAFYPDVVRDVVAGDYDALWMNTYADANAWALAAVEPLRGTRVYVREEQTLLHDRPVRKAVAKRVGLRALFARTWGLYIGEESRRHFLHYGMPAVRLFRACYCVDNEFFQRRGEELRPRRRELRAQFGIESDSPVVVYVAKLIPKKDPFLLLDAFERVRAQAECSLLMVGDGELLPEARRRVAARGVPDVHFAGFVNQGRLPEAYLSADIFCLPSVWGETWGLVVNEALNFALPVVVTDKVGSGTDLVDDGRSGFIVPAGEPEPMAARLLELVGDERMREEFGRRGRERVDQYSVEVCADEIVRACLAGR